MIWKFIISTYGFQHEAIKIMQSTYYNINISIYLEKSINVVIILRALEYYTETSSTSVWESSRKKRVEEWRQSSPSNHDDSTEKSLKKRKYSTLIWLPLNYLPPTVLYQTITKYFIYCLDFDHRMFGGGMRVGSTLSQMIRKT